MVSRARTKDTSCREGDVQAVKARLLRGEDVNEIDLLDGLTPLHYAALFDRKDLIKLLIASGAEVNAGTYGDNPMVLELTELVSNVRPLHMAVVSGDESVVALLLDKRGNANAADNSGNTPLHYAAWLGRREIVRLLLAHGAHVNAMNSSGYTPLFCKQPACLEISSKTGEPVLRSGLPLLPAAERDAQRNAADYAGVVKLLLAAGADRNAKSQEGTTPLESARTQEVRQLLLGVSSTETPQR